MAQRSLTTKKKHVPANLQRYSKFVKFLRFLLPATALAIIVVLFSWTGMDRNIDSLSTEDPTHRTIGQNELLSPRFESHDADKQPYNITAARAFQKQDNLDIVHLEKPLADISLKDGSWVALEADNGLYNQNNRTLSLHGSIKLYHDDGYELHTDQLNIDMDAQYAHTDVSVTGQGPAGTLEAKGMKAHGNKGTLIFTGPAKATIYRSLDLPGG